MARKSDHYQLVHLMSENELCETWRAVSGRTGRECFLKIAATGPALKADVRRQILQRSYECQRPLHRSVTIKAVGSGTHEGRYCVEYPLINSAEWQPLSAGELLVRVDDLLPRLCLIVDYLHQLGLVHCDLKLDNFLVTRTARKGVLLADLDFLRPANTPALGLLQGAPEHIAPELLADSPATVYSDNFAVGSALERCVREYWSAPERHAHLADSVIDRLGSLAARLRQETPQVRPRVLIEALHECGLVDEATFRRGLGSLLSLQLRSQIAGTGPSRRAVDNTVGGFLEKARVLGLHQDVLDLLEQRRKSDRAGAFLALRRLLGRAELQMVGDYWIVKTDDTLLWETYTSLDGSWPSTTAVGSGPVDPVALLDIAEGLHRAKRFQQAYIFGQQALRLLDASGGDREAERALDFLVGASEAINRISDAVSYLKRLLELPGAKGGRRLLLLGWLVDALLECGLSAEAKGVLTEALPLAEAVGTTEQLLDLRRSQAWIDGAAGDYAGAESTLRRCLNDAENNAIHGQYAKALNNLSVLAWRQEDYALAEELARSSLKWCAEYGVRDAAVTAHAVLCYVHKDQTRYRESLEAARRTLELATGPEDVSRGLAVYGTAIWALCRLGDLAEATAWNQRWLPLVSPNINTNHLVSYVGLQAYIEYLSGRVDRALALAEESFRIAVHHGLKQMVPPSHCRLVELHMAMGDEAGCARRAAEGRAACAEYRDRVNGLEIDLYECVCSFCGGDSPDMERLVDLIREACSLLDWHPAAFGLIHVLLNADDVLRGRALRVAKPLVEAIRENDAPVFQAALVLAGEAGAHSHADKGLAALKLALEKLVACGQILTAAVVCRNIARIYAAKQLDVLGRKFYAHAASLARSLGNEPLAGRIESEAARTTSDRRRQTRLIASFHSVSQIIGQIDSQEKALEQLVQFAVDESGAERGVLMLRNEPGGELRVVACVGCDDITLEDVPAISSSVPAAVSDALKPLVVDNAVADPRTQGYKSIIAHNILSLVCLPLVHEGKSIGVLYLDHHSIPAVFSEDDIVYMHAIANFAAVTLAAVQRYRDLHLMNRELIAGAVRRGDGPHFVSRDPRMEAFFSGLRPIARGNVSVLITGERGSGKELVAEWIHRFSQRKDKPLIKVNCSAIPESLAESELFGVAKGAATHTEARPGKFEAADGGTMFLDEIGDMPWSVQAKVLSAIEYGRFERVGSLRTMIADIRFICATNRDLRQTARDGQFRYDLLDRIAAVTIELPPLRERTGDIIPLLEHFAETFAPGCPPRFTGRTLSALLAYHWPGNARELKNLVERCCLLYPGQDVPLHALAPEIEQSASREGLGEKEGRRRSSAGARESLYQTVLRRHKGNQSAAARELGLALSTFRYWVKKLRIH